MDKLLREKILERDGFKCTMCGRNGNGPWKLHVHHKIPISVGGPDTETNLITVCSWCHAEAEDEYWSGLGLHRPKRKSNHKSKLVYLSGCCLKCTNNIKHPIHIINPECLDCHFLRRTINSTRPNPEKSTFGEPRQLFEKPSETLDKTALVHELKKTTDYLMNQQNQYTGKTLKTEAIFSRLCALLVNEEHGALLMDERFRKRVGEDRVVWLWYLKKDIDDELRKVLAE